MVVEICQAAQILESLLDLQIFGSLLCFGLLDLVRTQRL
jgi:hypothetical protein